MFLLLISSKLSFTEKPPAVNSSPSIIFPIFFLIESITGHSFFNFKALNGPDTFTTKSQKYFF